MKSQVLVKVLNLNVRSMASPFFVRVHLPPFVDNRGLSLCLRASTSAPFEMAGSILPVVWCRAMVREMAEMTGRLTLGGMVTVLMLEE